MQLSRALNQPLQAVLAMSFYEAQLWVAHLTDKPEPETPPDDTSMLDAMCD
jgi:hypothetical protein